MSARKLDSAVESLGTAHSQLSTVDCELPLTEGFDAPDLVEAKALLDDLRELSRRSQM